MSGREWVRERVDNGKIRSNGEPLEGFDQRCGIYLGLYFQRFTLCVKNRLWGAGVDPVRPGRRHTQ